MPREIVMHATRGAETLNHELVHPIIQEDFPRAPAWLDEGIAALYENPVYSCAKGYVTGISNWRYPDVLQALDAQQEAKPRAVPQGPKAPPPQRHPLQQEH